MRLELHVYHGDKMPVCGVAEFWRVQEKIKLRQACISTNQLIFISQSTCDAGYKIFLHRHGRVTPVYSSNVDAVYKYLTGR